MFSGYLIGGEFRFSVGTGLKRISVDCSINKMQSSLRSEALISLLQGPAAK